MKLFWIAISRKYFTKNAILSKFFLNIFVFFPKSFKVVLVDMNTREKIPNTDRISLDIAVYSYEKPPKIIQINNIGILTN